MKKTKIINVIYTPLHLSTSVLILGGSLSQTHCAETDEYIPDREITPLVLKPEVYITDPDGIMPDGLATLVNVEWFEFPEDFNPFDDEGALITEELQGYRIFDNDGYAIATDGSLIISRNVPYLSPIQLLFSAVIPDMRSGKVLRVQGAALLNTTSIAVPVTMVLDKPASFVFDPVIDSGLRTINAIVTVGGRAIGDTPSSAAYWWYKRIDDVDTLITDADFFYVSGLNTSSLVIDPRYINKSVRIVCKAEYITASGSLPQSPTANAISATTLVLRRYKTYDFDHVIYGGIVVNHGVDHVRNKCEVIYGDSVINDPTPFFRITWTLKDPVYGAQERVIGYGPMIDIKATKMIDGTQIGVELEELEPLKGVADGESYITDNNIIITD